MTCRGSAAFLAAFLTCLSLVGCGQSVPGPATAPHATRVATWSARRHVRGVVDLSAPRRDGSIVVAAAGRLGLATPGAGLRPFATSYAAPRGLEAYITLSAGQRVGSARCLFPGDNLYALRLTHGDGVTVVGAGGAVRRFARLPSRGLENGIAFDTTGRFGHRLLVTAVAAARTTVYAIDCHGRVQVLTRDAPRVEGGITVAPATFGRFAGDLIAPDELSGKVFAITPAGRASLVARSGLPHGQDVGVESEGFVPSRFSEALVADRRTRRNRHPGDDLILGISRAALTAAGVLPGDMLAVGEGGATTIAVRCATSCRVLRVAGGPRIAHIEGHVVFSRAPLNG